MIQGKKNDGTGIDKSPSINFSEIEENSIISLWYNNGTNEVNIEKYIAGYVTIYFQNNWKWGTPRIYYWGGSSSTEWPGTTMTKVGNDGTYDIYKVNIPHNTTGIIFSNNGSDQTIDIKTANGFNPAYYGAVYYMSYNNYRNEVGVFNSSVLILE